MSGAPARPRASIGFENNLTTEQQIPEPLTIWTPLHGDRRFEKLGIGPYQTKDGRTDTLSRWQGKCAMCGGPYEVMAVRDPAAILHARQFDVVTLPSTSPDNGWTSKLRSLRSISKQRQAFQSLCQS
jgi:hypothetical protein